ncbi:hypothetical protein [Streptomyces sp. NPDC018947]|uniref:hypothetical protein n=1 Tax=Streptomyces sp. NPDC018947 TaxID=3365054 RepID=UPI0037AEECA2
MRGPGKAEIATMADDLNETYGAWLAGRGLSEAIERACARGAARMRGVVATQRQCAV